MSENHEVMVVNENHEVIEQCRAFADFLERHDDLPKVSTPEFEAYFFWSDDAKANVAAFARAGMNDAGVNEVEKEYSSAYFYLRLLGGFTLRVCTDREKVCTRREVGTETVTQRQLPEGVKHVDVEVERPIYEWDCDPILSA